MATADSEIRRKHNTATGTRRPDLGRQQEPLKVAWDVDSFTLLVFICMLSEV